MTLSSFAAHSRLDLHVVYIDYGLAFWSLISCSLAALVRYRTHVQHGGLNVTYCSNGTFGPCT